MIIAVTKETTSEERRVALTPSAVKKLTELGIKIKIEKDAGQKSGYDDQSYIQAGAEISQTAADCLAQADFLFKINAPKAEEWNLISENTSVIADFRNGIGIDEKIIEKKALSLYALERIPRISRAQNMDILSSQDNLSGYKAALDAVNRLNRAAPMMTTAAGSVLPIKVLVIGIGVAGLQAIATAKRLGANVSATDVRAETKEQALSLGARFIENSQINEQLTEADIIITAAGSAPKAPVLVKKEQLDNLKKDAIMFDLSGNVENPEHSPSFRTAKGAEVIFNPQTAALIPYTASNLFANNISNFFRLLSPDYKIKPQPDFNDEIIASTCIYYQGKRR